MTYCNGLIPAHAGKTKARAYQAPVWWAHPRSRGENPDCGVRVFLSEGSSPLTRGKPTDKVCGGVGHGLIPAHAGKTYPYARTQLRRRAHPRSRGENHLTMWIVAWLVGSSPLTRGKPAVLSGPSGLSRLIPAHAGKTLRVGRRRAARGAHPRSRGENIASRKLPVNAEGSSPLTRGKLGDLEDIHARVRLIPAHAGKTSSTRSVRGFRRAHPRSRGENRRHARQDTHDLGSSPLTRGKLGVGVGVDHVGGLIPAHAGKT